MLMGEIEELPTVFPNLSSWWNFVVKIPTKTQSWMASPNYSAQIYFKFVVFISSCLRDIFNSVVSNNKARN